MKYSEFVKRLQTELNRSGEKLDVDGKFGPKTVNALLGFDIAIVATKLSTRSAIKDQITSPLKTEWFTELKKHEGKIETDSKFQAYLVTFWKKSGLDFKSLVGSAFAWCGLFIFAGFYITGFKTPVNAFRAKSWSSFGQAIDYKTNGIPKGAVVRINDKGDCNSDKGNHVTLANGDCSNVYLLTKSSTFDGYGGNQSNTAKVSTYLVSKICSVRWPSELPLPHKITQSKNCSKSSESKNESTR